MSELARALAARTGTRPEDWFGVLKARSGMEVAFRVLREVRGPGSVLTQVFTCATAVDRYEPGTLPVTEDLVERVVNLPTTVTPARAERIAARVRELLG